LLYGAEKGNEARAAAFVEPILERCAILETTPSIGRQRPDIGPRFRSLPVHPIVVFYRVVDGDSVEVLRIVDGRRDFKTEF
jgi:plasmid stabilization system protein ParE